MSNLNFYTNPQSRGQIVRWMLEEIGEPYEAKIIAYGEQMKTKEFLAVNPMGKVPALVHGKNTVTETAAICCYLADAFPEKNLAPGLTNRAEYYRWMFFAAGPLEAAVTNKTLGLEIPREKQPMAGYGNFELTVRVLEGAVKDKEFIANNKFSTADIYVGSQIGWGMFFGTLEKTPVLEKYWEGLSSREAYKRAKGIDEPKID